MGSEGKRRTSLAGRLVDQIDEAFSGNMTDAQRSGTSRQRVDTEVAGVLAVRRFIQEHTVEDLEPVGREIERIVALIDASSEM